MGALRLEATFIRSVGDGVPDVVIWSGKREGSLSAEDALTSVRFQLSSFFRCDSVLRLVATKKNNKKMERNNSKSCTNTSTESMELL